MSKIWKWKYQRHALKCYLELDETQTLNGTENTLKFSKFGLMLYELYFYK